ncbi:peptide ABC transporter substrate-binding protein [Paracrocinitomix mangrovi]|uniref:peptide ABC transporter substrate-binding protein n=1 Tax=Paracrocinitomix mangrovi TaxID=2862509 RepID=UPI001C8D2B60|nr:peptide ABC transporter substrate-binding protein [Paracrocinitomix mangrovi]UKN00856.1 peptide ABC transporter substrate-binding protein [Paracrocinitomix mangrovi]
MKPVKLVLLNAVFAGLLFSCSGSGDSDGEGTGDPNELVKVEGGKFKGGVLRVNSIEDYTSLFPVGINDVYSTHIAGNVYEGLFRFDQKTLETLPALAESFDIDNSKTKYTFNIRKGIKFHDDECFEGGKGREVTADDFKYCLEYVCSNHEANKWNSFFRGVIVGVEDYQSGKAKSVEGIKVVNDHTLEVKLEDPLASFPDMLALLATAVYPHEAIEKYGYEGMDEHMVGTGPFIPTEISNGKIVKFKRNENYWRVDEFGNKLPFLAQIEVSFIKDKKEELEAFKNDELDMVWGLPVEEIPNIMGSLEEAKEGKNKEFKIQSVNSLNIQYYGFRFTSETFKDINVRKAFNYAVDRDSLVEFVLDGEGVAAHNGFVPPMKSYPYESVKGFNYDPKLAKQFMAKAGYPNGKGFPELTLYLNKSGGVNVKIAEFITAMLKDNLGVKIKLETMPMSDLYPKVEAGELDFWRFGWIADYPDPATFLHLFHSSTNAESGDKANNYFGYSSEKFDATFEEALKEIDPEKRNKLYAAADQIIIDDAVIMPLMFTVGIRLINPELNDFDINEMEYRDMSVVYLKEREKSNVRVYDNIGGEEDEEYSEE